MRLLIISFLLFSTFGCDDDIASSEVPSVIENTFKTHFPDASDVDWETHGNDFEVDFELAGTDHSARVDHAGTLMGYKYEIKEENLPKTLKDEVQKKYSISKWEDAEMLINGRKTHYQLEIEGFITDTKLVLDSTGNEIEDIKYWN